MSCSRALPDIRPLDLLSVKSFTAGSLTRHPPFMAFGWFRRVGTGPSASWATVCCRWEWFAARPRQARILKRAVEPSAAGITQTPLIRALMVGSLETGKLTDRAMKHIACASWCSATSSLHPVGGAGDLGSQDDRADWPVPLASSTITPSSCRGTPSRRHPLANRDRDTKAYGRPVNECLWTIASVRKHKFADREDLVKATLAS